MDIVTIGLMFDSTGPENPVQLDGWHVNSLQLIPDADSFLVHPKNPKVGVSGHSLESVHRYVFESKEQAAEYLPAVNNFE